MELSISFYVLLIIFSGWIILLIFLLARWTKLKCNKASAAEIGPGFTIISLGVTPLISFISKSAFPNLYNNPGVAYFEVNLTTYTAQNIKMMFMDLDKTMGWKTIPYDVSLLPINVIDFSS